MVQYIIRHILEHLQTQRARLVHLTALVHLLADLWPGQRLEQKSGIFCSVTENCGVLRVSGIGHASSLSAFVHTSAMPSVPGIQMRRKGTWAMPWKLLSSMECRIKSGVVQGGLRGGMDGTEQGILENTAQNQLSYRVGLGGTLMRPVWMQEEVGRGRALHWKPRAEQGWLIRACALRLHLQMHFAY